jgi:small subunit ribosomal protein S1
MSDSFAELYESNLQNIEVTTGTILSAQVVEIGQDWVTLDSNLKSESYISKKQFLDAQGNLEINIGDEVDVYLEALEDGYGCTRLSRAKAKQIVAWRTLEQAYEKEEIIKGFIQERVNGGFTVQVGIIDGFLPGSLIDIRPVLDPSVLENTEAEFKIVKLDYKRENVVVSRRAALEEQFQEQYAQQLLELKEGAVVEGTVKNITDYGAFVSLGIIDGLLHITDISWQRVKHPSDVLTVGETIQVKILKFEPEKRRVSLGIKQLSGNPWDNLTERYQPNMKLQSTVTNITDYGCFAKVEDGIEGLVHVSEMGWGGKTQHPDKIVAVGDNIEVMILQINPELNRISLSMKRCLPNPWEEFEKQHKVGDKISGKIKSVTNFGMFIALTEQIDGLIHNADLAWKSSTAKPLEEYQVGEEVESAILTIDANSCRVSLGIKQLSGDPFSSYVDINPQGSIVPTKVLQVEDDYVVLTLADNLEVRLRESKNSSYYDAYKALKVGDSLEVIIAVVDTKKHSIKVSMDTELKEDTKKLEKSSAQTKKRAVTLGDLIKEQMKN